MNNNKAIKGQSMLEVCIIFITLVLFLAGVMKIWLWSNNQFVYRQRDYNASRVEAGTAIDGYKLQWPLDYTPEELTEDYVLVDHHF